MSDAAKPTTETALYYPYFPMDTGWLKELVQALATAVGVQHVDGAGHLCR
jgi:hypothetical protein